MDNVGQRVEITHGAFRGYFATIVGRDGKRYVVKFEHSGGYKSYGAANLAVARKRG